ncbi:MAG: alkaline phosphatase [Pirellulales bacterium]
MTYNRLKLSVLALVLVASAAASCAHSQAAAPVPTASAATVSVASTPAAQSDAATRDAYFLTKLPNASGKEPATDSASAATAMATGSKTDDGNIAWKSGDPDDGALTTIAELLREKKGFSIGIVSTVPFSHATPAAFASHNKSRGNTVQIDAKTGEDAGIAHEIIAKTKPEVVIGGGHPNYYSAKPSDKFTYISAPDYAALTSGTAGYVYVGRVAGQDGAASLAAVAAKVDPTKGGRLFGLFGGEGGNFEFPVPADRPGSPAVRRGSKENPTLADAVRASLGVLAKDRDGFFALFEQGDIDWANHENNYKNMVGAMWGLDQAVRAAEAFVDQPNDPIDWSNTLVIVTADHSNSYLRAVKPLTRGDLPRQKLVAKAWTYPGGEVTYRTKNHTNELVTLWARGARAGSFGQYTGQGYPGTRIVDNTRIYHVMRRAADAGVKHILLFIGDGMNVEHEMAGSRYLYGEDLKLAWHGWGKLADGWAGCVATWDVTTYNLHAVAAPYKIRYGGERYDAGHFFAEVGYDPSRGGATPFPLKLDRLEP